jgi:hypothetical protein
MGDQLTERIIGAAIEVHKILGPGLLESIYEQALSHEMGLRGIAHERQKQVDVLYKGAAVAQAQVLSYLRATGLKQALLLNFEKARLVDGIQRFSM